MHRQRVVCRYGEGHSHVRIAGVAFLAVRERRRRVKAGSSVHHPVETPQTVRKAYLTAVQVVAAIVDIQGIVHSAVQFKPSARDAIAKTSHCRARIAVCTGVYVRRLKAAEHIGRVPCGRVPNADRVAPKSDTDAQKPFELRRMYRVASLPQGSFPKGICVILMLIPLICKMIVLFVSYRAFQSA